MLLEQPLSATLTTRERWLLIFSLTISLFVGALDQTVVSTATPLKSYRSPSETVKLMK